MIEKRVCVRCKKEFQIGQQKTKIYCSFRCCKLYLKSQYKKRNRDKIREYNRQHRAKAFDGYSITNNNIRERIFRRMPCCQRCGINDRNRLNLCHVKPHWAGGLKLEYNIIVFCDYCHNRFDMMTKRFWKDVLYV